MSELEQVSKEMMDELEEFGKYSFDYAMELFNNDQFPSLEYYRCTHGIDNDYNVFLKIIEHVNGEPQFESEKPKKWIVRSKKIDLFVGYWFLALNNHGFMNLYFGDKYTPYKFDTREEAEKWTNPQTEVVEVEE